MNTDIPILKELNQRKSVRAFLPKEIEAEKVTALFEAARWAPSSDNGQEWRYYAATGDARAKFADVLTRGNQWALHAPLLIAVTRDTEKPNGFESREYSMYDTALSVMSLVVEAEHQGLRAHQMAGFMEEVFRSAFAIPPNEVPVVVVAIGYEGDPETLDERSKEKEKKPRTRKGVEEILKIIPS